MSTEHSAANSLTASRAHLLPGGAALTATLLPGRTGEESQDSCKTFMRLLKGEKRKEKITKIFLPGCL